MDPAAAGQLGGRPRKLVAETKKTDKAVASGKQGTLQFSGNSIVIHHVSAPVTINISGHAHAAPALAGSKRRIGDADKDEDGSGGESGESDGEDAEDDIEDDLPDIADDGVPLSAELEAALVHLEHLKTKRGKYTSEQKAACLGVLVACEANKAKAMRLRVNPWTLLRLSKKKGWA